MLMKILLTAPSPPLIRSYIFRLGTLIDDNNAPREVESRVLGHDTIPIQQGTCKAQQGRTRGSEEQIP